MGKHFFTNRDGNTLIKRFNSIFERDATKELELEDTIEIIEKLEEEMARITNESKRDL